MLKLENVCKNINGLEILKNINFELKRGEFIAIMGKSGSGKSTLLNLLGTLDTPTSGKYTFNGKEVKSLSNDKKATLRREEIGFIFQRYNLLSLLSIEDNIALPAIYDGVDTKDRKQRVKTLLEKLGLLDKLNSYPGTLSGGQQQRISIARALMNAPSLILADEPTGALDSTSGKEVLKILRLLNAAGQSIIIVTHDEQIAKTAQKIIHIQDGSIVKIEENKDFKKLEYDENLHEGKKMRSHEKNFLYFYKVQLLESFKMSLASIYAQKLRSILTMLGIIIGIASVVCVSALGLGAKEKILSSISSIGTNTIQVVAGRSLGDIHAGRIRLALSDMELLKRLPYLDAVEAYLSNLGVATYKNKSLRAILFGIGEAHLRLRGLKLAAGREIAPSDISFNANVAVIDSNTRKFLFKGKEASELLGKIVIYNNQPLKIIGVLKPKDNYGPGDDTIRLYVPYTTSMNKLSGVKRIRAIVAKIMPGYDPKLAEDNLIRVLKLKRGKKDFYTINSDSIQKAVEENSATLMLLISGVALISLVVGGIGVMNIMLVCVSERTKEIGIKMAIGARRSDVKMQFLIEAVLICLIGSFLGLALSLLIIYGFNQFEFGVNMLLSVKAMIIGLISSVLIGVIFGFFPAKNASKLDPIKALS